MYVCLFYYFIVYIYELKVGWNLKIFSFNSGFFFLIVLVVYGYKVIYVNNVVNMFLGFECDFLVIEWGFFGVR